MNSQRFAILVVWSDGEEEYLKSGANVAVFSARSRADEQVEFMKMGMDGDPDVQSISVVRAPRLPRKRARVGHPTETSPEDKR